MFATCTTGNYMTKYGCFAAPTASELATYTPIPIYFVEGPSRFALNFRISKTFGFGPVVEGAGNSGGGGSGGGDYSQPPVSMPRSAQRPPATAPSPATPDEFNQGITDDDVPF